MGFEFSILDFIQGIRTPALDTIMCFITKLGNAGILWILLAAVLIAIPKTRKSGVIVMVALVFDVILCNGILKNLVGRIRPCDINTAVQLLVPRPTDFRSRRGIPQRHSQQLRPFIVQVKRSCGRAHSYLQC